MNTGWRIALEKLPKKAAVEVVTNFHSETVLKITEMPEGRAKKHAASVLTPEIILVDKLGVEHGRSTTHDESIRIYLGGSAQLASPTTAAALAIDARVVFLMSDWHEDGRWLSARADGTDKERASMRRYVEASRQATKDACAELGSLARRRAFGKTYGPVPVPVAQDIGGAEDEF